MDGFTDAWMVQTPAGTIRRPPQFVVSRVLRVFPRQGYRWPLWENGIESNATTPGLYGLSPEVTAGLRAWQNEWSEHCDEDGNWPSPEFRARSTAEIRRLTGLIRAEIGSWIHVVLG